MRERREKDANVLFNAIVTSGVVSLSPPSQRLLINMLDDRDFGVKVDFCRGEGSRAGRRREPGEKPSPHTSSGCSGGRH